MAEDSLIPGLPDEVAMLCLARLPFPLHPLLSSVCRSWRRALQPPVLFHIRAQLGLQEHFLFVVMPVNHCNSPPCYLFDSRLAKCYPLMPTPHVHFYPPGYRFRCSVVSLGRQVLISPERCLSSPPGDLSWGPLCFDVVSRRWCTQSLRRPRLEPRFGKNVYAAGGRDFKGLKRAEPLLRSGFASATVDGYVYAVGGRDFMSAKSRSDFEVQSLMPGLESLFGGNVCAAGGRDLKGLKRTEPLAMLEPRSGFASATVDGYVYAVGGRDFMSPASRSDFEALKSAERFDLASKKWERIPDMREERYGASGVAWKGSFYVLGGWHYVESEDDISGSHIWSGSAEVWDALKEEWQLIPEFFPCGMREAEIVKGKLYALKDWHEETMLMLLDEKTNRWISLGSLTDTLQEYADNALQGHASCEMIGVGDELWMLVGPPNIYKCALFATDPESLPLRWRFLPFDLYTYRNNVCVVTL